MKNITSLNVRGNRLQTISHTISQMICLKNLDLSDNIIAEFPSTLVIFIFKYEIRYSYHKIGASRTDIKKNRNKWKSTTN